MLISLPELRQRYQKDKKKLENLIRFRAEAPQKYQQWTENLASLDQLFSYTYHAAVVDHFSGAKTESQYLLDWGAGLGQVSYLLQDSYRVNAYNPVEDDLNSYWHKILDIKERSHQDAPTGTRLPFKDGVFDGVISSGVLEHVFEYGIHEQEALAELHRVLKPEGYLYIWHLPIKNSRSEISASRKGLWRHIKTYEFDEVLVLLSITGYEIVAIEKNELFFNKLLRLLSRFSDPSSIWQFDTHLCRQIFLKKMAHHFTIIAKKIDNFPKKPATQNYTVYLK